MVDWEADLDSLIEETKAFAKSVRVEPLMPRANAGIAPVATLIPLLITESRGPRRCVIRGKRLYAAV